MAFRYKNTRGDTPKVGSSRPEESPRPAPARQELRGGGTGSGGLLGDQIARAMAVRNLESRIASHMDRAVQARAMARLTDDESHARMAQASVNRANELRRHLAAVKAGKTTSTDVPK